MGVHDHVRDVFVICEHVIPDGMVEVEGIMEDELEMGSLILHVLVDTSIESLQKGEVR